MSICGFAGLSNSVVSIMIRKRKLNAAVSIGNKNATSHIIQAISMTVQRGNANSIMGALGPLRKVDNFFDVISLQE